MHVRRRRNSRTSQAPVCRATARRPRNLLDDSFSGHLFETAFVPGIAGDDSHFEDRVQAAESIWIVKVATVSREGSLGDNRRYSLVFRALETLSGPPPRGAIQLTVSGKDPSFHWLDRVGGAWVGREVTLMVRTYRAGEHAVMHFHGESNSPELRARILQIRATQAARAAACTEEVIGCRGAKRELARGEPPQWTCISEVPQSKSRARRRSRPCARYPSSQRRLCPLSVRSYALA